MLGHSRSHLRSCCRLVTTSIRHAATSTTLRTPLAELLPRKKAMNKILFDQDSRLRYNKVIKVYDAIYSHVDDPENIRLPKFVKGQDLMVLKDVLAAIRNTTNTINRNLVDLENELIEQASELGNNDAIATLAFKTVQDPSATKEDYKYANKLIDELSQLKHPLTFKLAGDLAYKKGAIAQAESFWLQFLELEPDTIYASHVASNLGIYYFSLDPKADLTKAQYYLEKSIAIGQLDSTIARSHYYYAQLFTHTNPEKSRHHLEICASKGLKESFASLGFMEMNVFDNYLKASEWFKLGVEADGDLTCLIGQFDCCIVLKNYRESKSVLKRLMAINEKLNNSNPERVPDNIAATIRTNRQLIQLFLETRKAAIALVSQQQLF